MTIEFEAKQDPKRFKLVTFEHPNPSIGHDTTNPSIGHDTTPEEFALAAEAMGYERKVGLKSGMAMSLGDQLREITQQRDRFESDRDELRRSVVELENRVPSSGTEAAMKLLFSWCRHGESLLDALIRLKDERVRFCEHSERYAKMLEERDATIAVQADKIHKIGFIVAQ